MYLLIYIKDGEAFMSVAQVRSWKYASEVMECIARRGSATYYNIGSDLLFLASRSTFHPVLKRLLSHDPALLVCEKDASNARKVKYWYSLTKAGEEMLEELRSARLRDGWLWSSRKHVLMEATHGILRYLFEKPATEADLVRRMAIDPFVAKMTLRKLRLSKFVVISPDDGYCYRVTDLGRDYLDLSQRVTEDLVE